jgi:hypothetical protein
MRPPYHARRLLRVRPACAPRAPRVHGAVRAESPPIGAPCPHPQIPAVSRCFHGFDVVAPNQGMVPPWPARNLLLPRSHRLCPSVAFHRVASPIHRAALRALLRAGGVALQSVSVNRTCARIRCGGPTFGRYSRARRGVSNIVFSKAMKSAPQQSRVEVCAPHWLE